MKKIEIKAFAERVEHLCDFLLAHVERDESKDVLVIQDLKEEAADIQFDQAEIVSGALGGLANYMKGINVAPEENVGKESE